MAVLKAVGDICPGDKTIPGLGVASACLREGPSYLFDAIRDQLGGADLLVGNLEGMLTRRLNRRSIRDLPFCGVPEFAEELQSLGFNVVSLANNHVFEHGPEVFLETVEHLQAAGIEVLGLRGQSDYHCQPVVVSAGELSVGFLAYNWIGTRRFPEADDYLAQSHDSLVNYTWDRKKSPTAERGAPRPASSANSRVHDDIKRLRTSVDRLILCPHWGYEFSNTPPFGVIQEAHSFLDAGVDLILGGHPHVLQGHENHAGKTVFYSLGNFLFDLPMPQSRLGVVLEYSLGDEEGAAFRYHFTKGETDHRVRPAAKKDESWAKALVEGSTRAISGPDRQRALSDDLVYRQYEKAYLKLKWLRVRKIFGATLRHPSLLPVVLQKLVNFSTWLLQRIRGNKERW